MKAVVTLQEDIVVPSMPNIEVPERCQIGQLYPHNVWLVRYRVPKLEGLAEGRHPIYGTNLKRINVKDDPDESVEQTKKKKKKRKSGDSFGESLSSVKEEPENVEEPQKIKKRKKDKKESA